MNIYSIIICDTRGGINGEPMGKCLNISHVIDVGNLAYISVHNVILWKQHIDVLFDSFMQKNKFGSPYVSDSTNNAPFLVFIYYHINTNNIEQ